MLKEEGSGILNWALDGAWKLLKNGGQIPRSEEHKRRIRELLLESDSVRAFVETMLKREPGGVVLSFQLYPAYCRFCEDQDWESLPDHKAMRQMKQEIESRFHITQRHDLSSRFGDNQRGYAGIALCE